MPSVFKPLAAIAVALATLTGASVAQAAACSATAGFESFVGGASTDDVTLGGLDSTMCVISGVNPAQGPDGNTSGFDGAFGGGWTLLSKGAGGGTVDGVNFTLGFSPADGTWSITTDQDATYDLVFAMHASNRSGAFMFDDFTSFASVTQNGTWAIEWLNNGGQVPGFSNINFFVRDVVTPVPEPETYALMLAGLGALGLMARRRRAS